MKANDEVPASQGKIPMAFTARAAVAANLLATQGQRWPKSRHELGNPVNVG